MVRRITRCCDTEQVGWHVLLSFFLLRSAGRCSWGTVFTCLFWPAESVSSVEES
uniref:Uncharacterized protein n=1 Tax=Arundo donax TaxID=35708 RepID=A0A0A9E4A1_ARUDO